MYTYTLHQSPNFEVIYFRCKFIAFLAQARPSPAEQQTKNCSLYDDPIVAVVLTLTFSLFVLMVTETI